MHGSVISLVKGYICEKYTSAFWDEVSPRQVYDETLSFSDEWLEIVSKTSHKAQVSEASVLHDFGYYVVQALLATHSAMLGSVQTTFAFVSNAELTMHSMARRSNANPPVIHAHIVSPTFMIVDYYSKRRMSGMAVGIIQGIADFCKERVEIIPQTDIHAERVQIQVLLK